jgi:hypothetical protein
MTLVCRSHSIFHGGKQHLFHFCLPVPILAILSRAALVLVLCTDPMLDLNCFPVNLNCALVCCQCLCEGLRFH